MNTHNLKVARGFDSKFPFDCVIIFEDSLPYTIIITNVPLIVFKRASFTNASLLQVMVGHSAMRGTFNCMSQENTSAPGLAFSTIEIVDLIKYIVVASLSSTRCKTSYGVCGGHDRRSVFKTVAIV